MLLGDLVTLQTGPFGSSLHQSDYVANGVPLVNPMHIVGGRIRATEEHTVSAETAQRLSDFRMAAGDVVIGRRGEMGRCAVVTAREHGWLCGTGSMVIRCGDALVPTFLQRLLSSREIVEYLGQESVGSTMANLNQKVLLSVPVRVPPVAEQHRIVDAIDELMPDHEAGTAELVVALGKLAQYRQSLLKAAVEGELTADWRASNPPQETGAELLARILRERVAGGAKREPEQADLREPTPLPDGWIWASLDQLLLDLRSGTAETSGREPTPYPVLKSSAVRQGTIAFDELNYLSAGQSARPDNFLQVGDLLITRLSGSVAYVGCCALVSSLPAVPIQYPDRIFCGRSVRAAAPLMPFVAYCFQAPYLRQRLEAAAKSTAGHQRISMTDLRGLPIPLPPMKELLHIVELVKSADDAAREVESAIEVQHRMAAAQRQNILCAAFAGQLVPQDPADEPASALLARIRAQRAQAAPLPPRKTRRARTAA